MRVVVTVERSRRTATPLRSTETHTATVGQDSPIVWPVGTMACCRCQEPPFQR